MLQKIRGRIISKGVGEGEAVITHQPISFLGGVDPRRGVINDPKHELYGTSIAKAVLCFPQGKGSTVGSYVMYQLRTNGKAPAAIINRVCETVVAVGAIISDIPLIDSLEVDPLDILRPGSYVTVNCLDGFIEVET